MKQLKIDDVKSVSLHDYRLNGIQIDYCQASINFQLETPFSEESELKIQHFTSFSVSREEPWGRGTYIFDTEIKEDGGQYKIVFILNSGDKIVIEAML